MDRPDDGLLLTVESLQSRLNLVPELPCYDPIESDHEDIAALSA
jgi:hypothetical protein